MDLLKVTQALAHLRDGIGQWHFEQKTSDLAFYNDRYYKLCVETHPEDEHQHYYWSPRGISETAHQALFLYCYDGEPTRAVYSVVDRDKMVSHHVDLCLVSGLPTYFLDISGKIWHESPQHPDQLHFLRNAPDDTVTFKALSGMPVQFLDMVQPVGVAA